jgi:DNA polymerase-3 subunit epsilon
LYTKRKLEEILHPLERQKSVAERQQARPAQPAAPANSHAAEAPKPAFQNNSPKSSPQLNSQPFKKKEEPAKPVDEDMLAQLAMKFGKSK